MPARLTMKALHRRYGRATAPGWTKLDADTYERAGWRVEREPGAAARDGRWHVRRPDSSFVAGSYRAFHRALSFANALLEEVGLPKPEAARKTVTKKVAREIADFLQTNYDMLRQDGHSPEDARLSARENTALTYIEKGYEKEGVWNAYIEPKEG